jgi:hypothetical protein
MQVALDFKQKPQNRFYLCSSGVAAGTTGDPTYWDCRRVSVGSTYATHNSKLITIDARIPSAFDAIIVTHELKPKIVLDNREPRD